MNSTERRACCLELWPAVSALHGILLAQRAVPTPLEDSRTYEWLKFGHLLGLALLAAGMGIETVAYARLRRASTLAQLRTWQRLPVENVTGVGLLLVVTGLAMAWQSWSFTDGWIVAALTLVTVFILAAASEALEIGRPAPED